MISQPLGCDKYLKDNFGSEIHDNYAILYGVRPHIRTIEVPYDKLRLLVYSWPENEGKNGLIVVYKYWRCGESNIFSENRIERTFPKSETGYNHAKKIAEAFVSLGARIIKIAN